jgi:hypothetical protein
MVKSAPKKPKAAKTDPHLSALPKTKNIKSAVAVADFLGIGVPQKATSYQVSEIILRVIDSLKRQVGKLSDDVLIFRQKAADNAKMISTLKAQERSISAKHSEAKTQIKILLARAAALGIDLTKDPAEDPIRYSSESTPGAAPSGSPQVLTQESSQWVSKPSRRVSRQAEQEEAA